jgi:mannan endo-1,4-beta-mannosidase
MTFIKSITNFITGTALVTVAWLHAAPANPNATPEAQALLQYLVSISGKQILSGQESMYNDGSIPSNRDNYVFQRTGKYPAVYTCEFGDVGKGNLADRKKTVSNAIAAHNRGSIIAAQYHMIQPDLVDGSGFSAMNIPGSGYTKMNEILTEGSTLNVEFKKRLDEMAGYFHSLQDAKVAVLWRPYHEMNGDFFWWSHQDKFKEFWIYTYNYLTTTKQCNNLLWVFGVNWYGAGSTGKNSPSFYYPGHEYVDVLGCDFYLNYGHAYDKRVHDDLRTLGGGKPIAIAENGVMPTLSTLLVNQPYWVYWSTWWGFEGTANNSTNTDALYTENYANPAVITLDEVVIPPASGIRMGKPAAKARPALKVSYQKDGILLRLPSGTYFLNASGKKIDRASRALQTQP